MVIDDFYDSLYKYQDYKIEIFNKKADQISNRLRMAVNDSERVSKDYRFVLWIGVFYFTIGMILWGIDEYSNSQNLIKQNEKLYAYCQSCGKRFSSIRNYGTEIDNSKNYAFCKECYSDGEFKDSNLSQEDFLIAAKDKIKQENWLTRKIYMNHLRRLERWNKD